MELLPLRGNDEMKQLTAAGVADCSQHVILKRKIMVDELGLVVRFIRSWNS